MTPHIIQKHHNYMSMIGGRFLMVRLSPLSGTERDKGFMLAWDEQGRKVNVPKLKQLVFEHVRDLNKITVPMETETSQQQETLNGLALLLARGRGVTLTEKIQEIDEGSGRERFSYRIAGVQIEEPYRALQQLRALGRALARVHGRSRMTAHEIELLRRVVLSSMPEDRAELMALLNQHPEGLSVAGCASALKKSRSGVRQLTETMSALQLIESKEDKGHVIFKLSSDFPITFTGPINPLDHGSDLV